MGKKILLVDDAMFMRRIIKKALAEIDLEEISEAEDGREAIRLYGQSRPDLVLLDITMPGMSGIETLKEIIGMDPHAKVIMCSSIGQDETIRESRRIGAIDFIVKPFEKNRLQKLVGEYLYGEDK